VSTAVILSPTPWSFRVVLGVPLLQRAVLCAQRHGFERVVVAAGEEGARVRRLLAADARTRGVEVAAEPEAALLVAPDAVLIPGDCLVTKATIARLGASDADSWRDAGCVQVVDDASVRAAERLLFAELRAETAESDGPIARLDRAASQWLSRRLVETPLRPNHITTIGTAIGLLGAWCLAQGSYGAGVLGTLLFVAAAVVDGCDGEVARLKFQETRFGGLFDVTTDNVVHAAIFVGLGVGQLRRDPDGPWAALLALLLVGVVLAATAGYVCILRHPETMRARPPSRTVRGKIRDVLLRGFEGLLNRDFAYLLLALAVIDRLGWFLWGAAFGTYLFAAALVWVYRWRDAD
jgi:1L-myo-inositol 1-phosphate cytidylyltransferase / CDP-L-myo-inositol myo-inositolphosphotransferase